MSDPFLFVVFSMLRFASAALLSRLGGVDSKPASLRALLAPMSSVRLLALCGSLSVLDNVIVATQAMAIEPRADNVVLLEHASMQNSLMLAHAILVAGQLMRNRMMTLLDSTSKHHVLVREALVSYFGRLCQDSIASLAEVVGADALLPSNCFSSSLGHVRCLRHQWGHPSLPLVALAQWLVRGFVARYGGFVGALRYVTRRMGQWIESNPVACRRTSVAYLRSPAFQMRCVQFKFFSQCASLLEDVSLLAVNDDDDKLQEEAWRANGSAAQELACTFVQLQTMKHLIEVERTTTLERVNAGHCAVGLVSDRDTDVCTSSIATRSLCFGFAMDWRLGWRISK